MKKCIYLITTITCVVIVFSCSPYSGSGASMRLDSISKRPDADMSKKLQAVVNIAAQLGWVETTTPVRIIKTGTTTAGSESQDTIGYKIVTFDEKNVLKTVFAWSIRDRDRLTASLDKKSLSYRVIALEHCRPWLDRDSPLPASASSWPRMKLLEWLVWEWSAKTLMKNNPMRESAVEYAVKVITPELARVQLGPDSIELTQWQDNFRDKSTFQTIASDLASQIKGILEAQPDPTERDIVLHRIQRAWFNDYSTNYPNRFLTNAYVDFGKGGYVDPLSILGMSFPAAEIRKLEKQVKFSPQDIPKFLEELAAVN